MRLMKKANARHWDNNPVCGSQISGKQVVIH
jgi:hypothetical protein